VFTGHAEALHARLRARQADYVQALAFEQAGRLQNQREALEKGLRTLSRLQAAQGENAVLAYPARRAGWVALWGVRGGALVLEREVGRDAFGDEAARGFVAALAAADPPRLPLPAAAIDEMLLVHGWLERHRATPNVLDLRALVASDEVLAEIAVELVGRVRLIGNVPAAGTSVPRQNST
jgi:excinuclease UvrABC nuclease subunit